MTHPNIPASAPAELHWLFIEEQPGARIDYTFRCPYGQAIYRFHKDIPEVMTYTNALHDYLENPEYHARTSKLGTKRVLTAKSLMVDAVLKHYGRFRVGSKKELKQRIRNLDAALAVEKRDADANLKAWRSCEGKVNELELDLAASRDAIRHLRGLLSQTTGLTGAALEALVERGS